MVSSVVSRLDSVSSASAADRSSNAVPCARAETAWRRRSWPVNSHRRSAVQRVRSRRDPWSPVSTPLVRVPARRRHGSTVRGALPTDQDPGHSRTSRLQLGRIVAVSAGRGPCEACTTSRRRTYWHSAQVAEWERSAPRNSRRLATPAQSGGRLISGATCLTAPPERRGRDHGSTMPGEIWGVSVGGPASPLPQQTVDDAAPSAASLRHEVSTVTEGDRR